MTSIRVAGVQMHVSLNLSENLQRIIRHIQTIETDFLLLPEMSLTGHHGEFGHKAAQRAWTQIETACRQAYTTVILGTGAIEDNTKYIQTRIISDQGELIGTHEKLVPTQRERDWCRPGQELRDFQHRELRFGCLTGNDLWVAPGFGPYPDRRLTCQLGERGVHAIFHSIDTGTSPEYRAYYESNLKLRAIESQCHIFTANAAAPKGQLNIHTGVMAPTGEWLEKCSLQGEQTYHYDLEDI